MKLYKKFVITTAVAFLPLWAHAQRAGGIKGLLVEVGRLVNLLIPISAACALLFFFWGLAQSILHSGEDVEEGKNIMKWGIVSLFIIVAIWGIVVFIQKAFGIEDIYIITT